jgi:hypothetical protein
MSVLVDVVNAISDTGQTISDFFSTGLYDYTTKAVAWFIRWYAVVWWQVKLEALKISWGLAQELIAYLNISGYLNSAYAALDARTMSMLAFFRIPEAINMIVSAAVTKFVFRFLGF